ncbi:MAG: hypothetical protein ACK5MN_03310 [Lachnospiraceae bacterium]
MHIIEDTGQKKGQHDTKNDWWKAENIEVNRCKLPYGDYALPPKIAVDTKRDIDEVAGNIGNDNTRFKNECIYAKECGAQLYILVENTDGITCVDDVEKWKNPRRFVSPKCIDGIRLAKSMRTMTARYGVEFRFCTPEESAWEVLQLLTGGE